MCFHVVTCRLEGRDTTDQNIFVISELLMRIITLITTDQNIFVISELLMRELCLLSCRDMSAHITLHGRFRAGRY